MKRVTTKVLLAKKLLLILFLLHFIIISVQRVDASDLSSPLLTSKTHLNLERLSQSLGTLTYELNLSKIQTIFDTYIKSNPNIYALQIYDKISENYIITSYKNGKITHLLHKNFPYNYIKPRKSYSTAIYYEGVKIGDLIVYIDVALNLSQKELKYLINHNTIYANNLMSVKPFNYNENDIAKGYSIDYLNLISHILNINMEYNFAFNTNEVLEQLQTKQIDIMTDAIKTSNREKEYLFTQNPYMKTTGAFASKSIKIEKFSELNDKILGVVHNSYIHEKILNEYPNIQLKCFDNIQEALLAVENGEVDATYYMLTPLTHILNNLNLKEIKIYKDNESKNNNIFLMLNKENEVLATLINKAIENIDETKLLRMKQKWLDLITNPKHVLQNKIFSEKEYEYIKDKTIKMCVIPDYMPYSKITKDGTYTGIIARFINRVKENSGLNISLLITDSWEQTHQYIKNKECDFIPFLIETPKRKEYLNFTKTYYKIPLVIATDVHKVFINNLNDVIDKKFGMIQGFATKEVLKKKYPNLQFVNVRNTEEGLLKVKEGELYGFISTLPNVAYVIQRDGLTNVKITGKVGYSLNIKMATAKEDLLLQSIIQKAILTVNQFEKEDILNKWVTLNYEEEHSYTKLWKIASILSVLMVVILFIIIIYRNAKLKTLNEKLEILSKTDVLTGLYNRVKIDEIFVHEIARYKRYHTPLSLIMLDIDFFKKINDKFGHNIGDRALVELANVLKQNVRKTDYIGRWGGEEFIIICTQTPLDGATNLSELIREAILKINFGVEYTMSASFGVTEFDESMTIKSFIKAADDALYIAKAKGRNQVQKR